MSKSGRKTMIPRGLDRALFHKLAGGEWIDAHDNLILCGPTGVGKSLDLLRKSGEFPVSNEELDDTATTVYEGI